MKNLYYLTWSLILCLFFGSCFRVEAQEDPFMISIKEALSFQYGSQSNGKKLECYRISAREFAASYHLAEEKIQELEDNFQAFVEFAVSDFTPGEQYTLYSMNMFFQRVAIGEYVADNRGQLVSTTNKVPLNDLQIVLNGFVRGEPSYYVLVSADKKTYVAGFVSPDPIEFEWSDGAYASLTMFKQDGTLFSLAGKGFRPDESLVVKSQSCDDTTLINLNTSPEGDFWRIIHPTVPKKTGGPAKIAIERSQAKKVGTLNYVWGDAIQKNCKNPN